MVIYLSLVFLAPFYFIFLLFCDKPNSFKDICDIVDSSLLHFELLYCKIEVDTLVLGFLNKLDKLLG